VSESLLEILRQELNVKQVVFPGDDDALVHLSARADFGKLGPVFGKRTPEVAEGISGLEPDTIRELRRGETVMLQLDGDAVQIEPEHVRILEEARGELTVQAEDGFTAAVDGRLDDELKSEGIARELVNRVQRLRRDSGLNISDRILLTVAGDRSIEEAALKHSDYIESETLAMTLEAGAADESVATWRQAVDVDGAEATIGIRRVEGPDR
jgi:isoleucyl-tRNA synthetase